MTEPKGNPKEERTKEKNSKEGNVTKDDGIMAQYGVLTSYTDVIMMSHLLTTDVISLEQGRSFRSSVW